MANVGGGGLEVSSRNPRWWFKGKDEVAYSFAALFTRETADSAVVRESSDTN